MNECVEGGETVVTHTVPKYRGEGCCGTRSQVGKTPLHVAVSIDCLDMVKCIVNAGAEVDHITAVS